jgi:DNA replication and repair protein RecF
MNVSELKLHNFRNYNKAQISFPKDIILIYGDNGIGKTNILESLLLLSHGKSSRVVTEQELVRIGETVGRIEGVLDSGDKLDITLIKEETSRVRKIYKLNNVVKTGTSFIGNLKSVLFAPEDIRLVAGSPTRRRDYLDKVLSQVDFNYRQFLLDYNKILKQRNKILEQVKGRFISGIYDTQISFWNDQLIEKGQYIQNARVKYFDYSKDNLSKISKNLFKNGYILELSYEMNDISIERLRALKDKEINYGTTLVGPHRDDFEFIIKNKQEVNLKSYGSRGEQRTGVFCIKILEINYIEDKTQEKPILLLDDIFSELDQYHRSAVEQVIMDHQTFITTADVNTVPKSILDKSYVIKLPV